MHKTVIHALKGFTLVELIVVITIVGILSTVGFVSYSGYLTGARDSNRISQLTKLSDSLQVYAASKSLPLPDNKINITASGASNIIAYQGYVGVDVLETIDYTNGGRDPKDDSYYTYYLTKNRKSMQLLALMEEPQNITFSPNTIFANYDERYPKVYGRKLGVLTQVTSNIPVQEVSTNKTSGNIDIVNTTDRYIAHITDFEKLEGTGALLKSSIPNGSCNRLKQTGGAKGNGLYTINPGGTGDIEVYCDMETTGGGWTLVARSVDGGTGTFNITSGRGDIQTDSSPYTISLSNISFSQKMIASYTTRKDINKSENETDSSTDLVVGSYTLGVSGITGGTSGDGLNGEQGMMFVK